MTYQISTYEGDDEYTINCKGDVVVGDEIRYEYATFIGQSGSFRNAKFAGFEMITGKVISDNICDTYRRRLNITLKVTDGSTVLISEYKLHNQNFFRKVWAIPEDRPEATATVKKVRKSKLKQGRKIHKFVCLNEAELDVINRRRGTIPMSRYLRLCALGTSLLIKWRDEECAKEDEEERRSSKRNASASMK